jgi:hypothetical protein
MKHRIAIPIPVLAAVLWSTCVHAAQALQGDSLLGTGATIAPESIGLAADSSAFAQGTRAINDGRWSDAIAIFSQIANQAGEHADGALYWKAYAQNKLGQSNAALDTCGALRSDHPASKWIEECGALEIEIHGKSGQPVQPKAVQSDDLKLLALATLMQHDEKSALAQVYQILNSGDSSEKLKRGALFIMGEHHTDTVYPQIVRVSLVEGDVRIARGIENKRNKNAAWEEAEADLPIESGYSLVTGTDGRAEIEFEDASTMYLGENSVLHFNDLTTRAGVPHSEVALLSGTATLHIRPYVTGEVFLLRTPTDNMITKYPGIANIRISSYTDGTALTSMGQGELRIYGAQQQPLTPGQTLYFKDSRRIMLAGPSHPPDFSAWDQWVETRHSAREKELAAVLKDSGLTSPIPGLAEMRGQGRFFACDPYGTCWEPTPASEPKPVAENSLPESDGNQGSSKALSQTAAATATPAKPTRQIGFVGKPMPNISASPFADMNVFWPCIPGDVRAMYLRGVAPVAYLQMQPWAWAVCHSGEWLYRGNQYVWVAGKRHHHPPCHWVKSGRTIILVPTHPRDVKDQLPVNRTNPTFVVNPKGPHRIERVDLERHAPIELMKEPPREFRAEFVRPLTHAAEPHMVAYRVQDAMVAKGEPSRPGIPITFNPSMQSFMMTEQQMHSGRSVSVSVPLNNHSGDLQGHGGFGGGGGVAHGGGTGGSSGGGSHATASSSSSGATRSSGSAPASSGSVAGSGALHH